LLARRFIEHYCKQLGFPLLQLSDTAVNLLTAYSWPGNVRELKNIIERAVVLHRNGVIAEEYLPRQMTAKESRPESQLECEDKDLESCVAGLETRLIERALHRAQGNKAKAARILNISERTLWYKLKKYNLGSSNHDEA
jgi:two-component system response regulator AtoC